MAAKRFTKDRTVHALRHRAEYLTNKYRFTTNTGYDQCDRKSSEVNRAYGEWRILLDLADWIEEGEFGCTEYITIPKD